MVFIQDIMKMSFMGTYEIFVTIDTTLLFLIQTVLQHMHLESVCFLVHFGGITSSIESDKVSSLFSSLIKKLQYSNTEKFI